MHGAAKGGRMALTKATKPPKGTLFFLENVYVTARVSVILRYVKAHGLGLGLDLKSISFRFEGEGEGAGAEGGRGLGGCSVGVDGVGRFSVRVGSARSPPDPPWGFSLSKVDAAHVVRRSIV